MKLIPTSSLPVNFNAIFDGSPIDKRCPFFDLLDLAINGSTLTYPDGTGFTMVSVRFGLWTAIN